MRIKTKTKANVAEKDRGAALYLTAAVYLLTLCLSFLLPSGGPVFSYGLIMQFASLFLPAALYISLKGDDVTKKMRVNGFSPAKTVLLLLFVLAMLCISMLSSLFSGASEVGTAVTSEPAFLGALCLAVLPAFAEELLFRGIVMTELESNGTFTAIAVSALLFAMYHFELSGFVPRFLCGLLLGLCVYVTRSLPAACAVHLIYNGVILLGEDKINAFFAITDDKILIAAALAVTLIVCLILIFGECQRVFSSLADQNAPSPRAIKGKAGKFFTALFSPGAAVCIIIFIVALLI